jgi:hypothetical protein
MYSELKGNLVKYESCSRNCNPNLMVTDHQITCSLTFATVFDNYLSGWEGAANGKPGDLPSLNHSTSFG